MPRAVHRAPRAASAVLEPGTELANAPAREQRRRISPAVAGASRCSGLLVSYKSAAALIEIYSLPYFWARASIDRSRGEIAYAIRRVGQDVALRARYGPGGAAFRAGPRTLEHFLAERYSLFTVSLGWVLRADIEHPPWSLQTTHAHIEECSIAGAAGIELAASAPLLHFPERQDVVIGPPRLLCPAS